MTERNTAKSKRSEGTKRPSTPAPEVAAGDDVAGLKAELTAARARISELEQKQADIVNRIDWVIDSLHNLTE